MTGADGRDSRCTEHGYCNRNGPAFSIMVRPNKFLFF